MAELHCLPDGLSDGILNRAQLARAFGVSENTVTAWISKGLPYRVEGTNGRAWEFQLSEAYAWVEGQREDERRRRVEGDRLAAEAAQAFLNLEDQGAADSGMSAREIRALAEAEFHRNKVAEQRGDLVRAERVRAVLELVFLAVQRGLVTLPDHAERELGLEPAAAATLEARCLSVLEEIRREIEESLTRPAEVVQGPGGQRALDL